MTNHRSWVAPCDNWPITSWCSPDQKWDVPLPSTHTYTPTHTNPHKCTQMHRRDQHSKQPHPHTSWPERVHVHTLTADWALRLWPQWRRGGHPTSDQVSIRRWSVIGQLSHGATQYLWLVIRIPFVTWLHYCDWSASIASDSMISHIDYYTVCVGGCERVCAYAAIPTATKLSRHWDTGC